MADLGQGERVRPGGRVRSRVSWSSARGCSWPTKQTSRHDPTFSRTRRTPTETRSRLDSGRMLIESRDGPMGSVVIGSALTGRTETLLSSLWSVQRIIAGGACSETSPPGVRVRVRVRVSSLRSSLPDRKRAKNLSHFEKSVQLQLPRGPQAGRQGAAAAGRDSAACRPVPGRTFWKYVSGFCSTLT